MQIGQLAAATGLSRDTLRFYERRGLLRAQRRSNGYRDYPEEAVQWLGYLRLAQNLGFTLAEIQTDLAALGGDGAAPKAAKLREVLRAKLQAIDERLRGLKALRAELLRRLEDPTLADCPLQPRRAMARRDASARRGGRTGARRSS